MRMRTVSRNAGPEAGIREHLIEARTASPGIVAVLRAAFEDWNEERIDSLAARYAEDAEFDLSPIMSDIAPIRGRLCLIQFWTTLRSNWRGRRVDIVDVLDLGGRRYLADCVLVGRESTPGEPTTERLAYLFTLDADVQIVRCQLAPDVDAAFRLAEAARV
jgi:hypothetical protein